MLVASAADSINLSTDLVLAIGGAIGVLTAIAGAIKVVRQSGVKEAKQDRVEKIVLTEPDLGVRFDQEVEARKELGKQVDVIVGELSNNHGTSFRDHVEGQLAQILQALNNQKASDK